MTCIAEQPGRSPSRTRQPGATGIGREVRGPARRAATSEAKRNGFSLLEVILAGAILVASVIILSRLAGIGRRHVISADEWTQSQWLCQTKMSEILAGIESWEPAEDQPLPGHNAWTYSKQFEPLEEMNLLAVTVTVREATSGLAPIQAGANASERRGHEYSLTRWLRVPHLRSAATDEFVARSADR